jgi:hypothetical protein
MQLLPILSAGQRVAMQQIRAVDFVNIKLTFHLNGQGVVRDLDREIKRQIAEIIIPFVLINRHRRYGYPPLYAVLTGGIARQQVRHVVA